MNYLRNTVLIIVLLHANLSFAQTETALRKLPSVNLQTLNGTTINSSELINKEGLTVINFWATWCKPCVLELNTIKDHYPNWKKELGIKIVAVTIDDTRNTSKVGPLVNGKGWEYDIILDSNSDFKRALNVNNIPHTFVLNPKGEIIWQHNSYAPGDEDELYEILKKNSSRN
jgi:cytochrome c biogenesis protein CcmG/thiol:disulfide interchange protein DsbE